MRKYDESMPSATNFEGLKHKVGIFFGLLAVPFIWYFSIRGLWEDGDSLARIPAKVVNIVQADAGSCLDVTFPNGRSMRLVSLLLHQQDVGKYSLNQAVVIVHDSDAHRRYDYCLVEYYEKSRLQAKIVLWIGALAPLGLFYFLWKKWTRAKSQKHDLFGRELDC